MLKWIKYMKATWEGTKSLRENVQRMKDKNSFVWSIASGSSMSLKKHQMENLKIYRRTDRPEKTKMSYSMILLSSSIFCSREVFRRQAQLLFALWKIARIAHLHQIVSTKESLPRRSWSLQLPKERRVNAEWSKRIETMMLVLKNNGMWNQMFMWKLLSLKRN